MKPLARSFITRFLTPSLCLLTFTGGRAAGQGLDRDGRPRFESFTSGGRFTPQGWLPSPGSGSYLPFGGMGGFIPYSPGPGLGLGVMSRNGVAAMNLPGELMPVTEMRLRLGQVRSNITPLVPIGIMSSGGMGRAGMSAGLIRKASSSRLMDGMVRPPVGSYPFRVPPSLIGPTTLAPAMSM
jgi:hypothetical protein